jgi:fructose-bisphosphate aldolase class II
MRPLRDWIGEYAAAHKALGHFNISDSNQLHAIALAVQQTGLPAIVGLSEGEREYFDILRVRAVVDSYQKEGTPLYLNADHTYSFAKAKTAIDQGVDSIVVDGAKLPMAENIGLCDQVVQYARRCGRDVVVEGELGYIGTSSKQLASLPEGVTLDNLTTAEDAAAFVAATKVDCFAPAVGNIHGMLVSAPEPRLHPERVAQIAAAAKVPLVLHGASGNTPEDIRACIAAGIAVVHINTEFRVAYRDGLKESLANTPDEVAPYKFLAPVEEKLELFIAGKLKLFAGV